MYHYCDCPITKEQRNRKNATRVPLHLTEVNKEGCCTNCGYYAVASRNKVGKDNSVYKVLYGNELSSREKISRESGKGFWQDFYIEHNIGN